MAWWKRIKETGSDLLENHEQVKEVVVESAEVFVEYRKALTDGNITTNEYVKIGKRAVIASREAYMLAVKMGWLK